MDDDDDVFEKEHIATNPPVFYLGDEYESDEPKKKKTKKQAKISKSDDIESNKENASVKQHIIQPAVESDPPHQDDSNDNVASSNSVNANENKQTNRICLHAPLGKEGDNETGKENAGVVASPGIFLEYAENDEKSSHAFQREEREPTPFFKTDHGGKETKSPFCNMLQPITPPESAVFEREPTPFYDRSERPPSLYLEDNSSTESSPDREVETTEKLRSNFLTVPSRATCTFEGPVRAPRDSTPTPFQGIESSPDTTLESTAGMRPPRESTPFFPKENDDGPNKDEAEDFLASSAGKDTSISKNQSGTNQSKTDIDLLLPKENDAGGKNKHSGRHNFDQIDRQTQYSSEISEGKNDKGEGMKLNQSSRHKAKTIGNVQKDSTRAKIQRQSDHVPENDLSDNSKNSKQMRSRESNVSNLARIFQQNPGGDKSRKFPLDMSTHRDKKAVLESITTADKGKLPDSIGQPSNRRCEAETAAVQMSSKSNKSAANPVDTRTTNSPESSVAARKAAAAQARKELYMQRKLQQPQTRDVEGKHTFAPIEKPTQSTTNSKHAEGLKDEDHVLVSPKPRLPHPAVMKPNQQSVIQSSLPLPKPGQKLLTSTPSNQVNTTGNCLKKKSATMTHETPINPAPHTPVTLNSSMSKANPQRITSATKSPELPKSAKDNVSSPTSVKTITPATAIAKSPEPTPASLAGSTVVSSQLGNLKQNKRSPSPKSSEQSFSKTSPKSQNPINSSNTQKKMELCKPTQLPLPSLQNTNVNFRGDMHTGIQDQKPRTSPTRPKAPFLPTATKNVNGCSEREKRATCRLSSPINSLSSSSSRSTATTAPAQPRPSPNVPLGIQPTLKDRKDKGGESVSEKNTSDKMSKGSKLTPTFNSTNRLCESSQRQNAALKAAQPSKPANLSSANPFPLSPLTALQKKTPISHRLEITEKTKILTATRKSSSGTAFESQEQNPILYSTLWSKLLKAFMNSFVNEKPQHNEQIRQFPKRRKPAKSKDSNSNISKGKSKVSRGKYYKYNWTKVSPFGQYTLEGIFLVCIMTLIALSADVRIEVFICYILAAYYTFFVLRVLKILD